VSRNSPQDLTNIHRFIFARVHAGGALRARRAPLHSAGLRQRSCLHCLRPRSLVKLHVDNTLDGVSTSLYCSMQLYAQEANTTQVEYAYAVC